MATAEELYLTDIKHVSDFVQTTGAGTSGDLQTVSGQDNLKEALFRRLMTSQRSIVHRPGYGVGILEYENVVATLDQKRTLARKIKDQFELDTRVQEVLGVRIESEDETPEKTIIIVRVKPVGLDEIEITYTPFGEETV